MPVLKWIGGALLALVVLLLVYGTLVEPRFLLDAPRYEAEVPHLPPAWRGRTVALLADFQVGMWFGNTGMVERAVSEAAEADLVLIAGDFVYKPDSATVRRAVRLVRPLAEAGVPTYAVLGNHDYSLLAEKSAVRGSIAQYLAEQLEAAGIPVLENEAVRVERDGAAGGTEAPLYLAGIGSVWAGQSDLGAALADVPEGAARIVLAHNPVVFRDLPPGAGPLTLSAHTHGGQIRLPLTPSESWLHIARGREVVADGWASDSIGAAGNRLYVNRGIGFSRMPVRLFCRPELTFFTLRHAAGTLPPRGPAS